MKQIELAESRIFHGFESVGEVPAEKAKEGTTAAVAVNLKNERRSKIFGIDFS
jgi:hypothetical protein